MAGWPRQAAPDPGLRPALELSGGHPSGMVDLASIGIGKGLPGEGFAAEEAPPPCLQIEPAGADRDADLLPARMGRAPLLDRWALVSGPVVGDE